MTENNDYRLSEGTVGWTAFFSIEDWNYFMDNLNNGDLKRLSGCRTGLISFELIKRGITKDNNIMGGDPCIPGTRIRIEDIKSLIEQGITPKEIVTEYYTHITLDQVMKCLKGE